MRRIGQRLRQLYADPVLKKWVISHLCRGRLPSVGLHRTLPHYIEALPGPGFPNPARPFRSLLSEPPERAAVLPLAGFSYTVEPGNEENAFDHPFPDLEQHLALHRFAWVPLIDDPAWTQALWSVWLRRFGSSPDESWAWHPYTAAERAINILSFARRHGLPSPAEGTLSCLGRHANEIAARLEYFGESGTSNHLFNNGRGLLILGAELGLSDFAALGAKIVAEEAKRLLLPSGILREGSSHYHVLLANRMVEVADYCESGGLSEAAFLKECALKSTRVARQLVLPGGMPLIGDVSPDMAPAPSLATLEEDRKSEAESLRRQLAEDGWLRTSFGPWTGLWYVSPAGWPPMPGHGHQDCGGFELHFEDCPIFVDPGRGSYRGGETDTALSGDAHNILQVDDKNPYPANKPYYTESFRQSVCGPAPTLVQDEKSVRLRHSGYSRLDGCEDVNRTWEFDGAALRIIDQVAGQGVHRICRRLNTRSPVEVASGQILLRSEIADFRITTDSNARIETCRSTYWPAYGSGEPATALEITVDAPLPWSGTISVERM